MSLLPTVRAAELLRALAAGGFEVQRQRGSHVFLRHEDGRTTVVPVQQGEDIDRGLLAKILRDAGISPTQFVQLLRRS